MNIADLKAAVIKQLVGYMEFTDDEAEELVANSYNHDDGGFIWHEDANPESIAKYLASSEDED